MNNNRTFVTVSSEMLRNGTKIKKSCHFLSVGNSSMVITRLFFTLLQLSKLSLKNYYLYSILHGLKLCFVETVKTRLLFKKDLVESEINIILKDTMVAKHHISFIVRQIRAEW